MKKISISYLIFILFSFLIANNMHAMKMLKKMPELVPDDDNILVTLNNNKGKVVYSSEWSPTQLSYFSTLNDQYAFNDDSASSSELITIHQSFIKNIEAFRLIEQAGALLETNHTQELEHKKSILKEYFAKTKDPTKLNTLLRISDFLNSPLVYNACKENVVAITREHIQKEQIVQALLFLQHFNNQYDAVYLGNHLMNCSSSIQQLLIKLQKSYTIKKIKQETSDWHCLSNLDQLFFKSSDDNDTLKFWHNNKIKKLYCKNRNYLHAACICNDNNKIFCVFRKNIDGSNNYISSLEMYDLDTGIFLCSKEINSDPKFIRHCPQKNLLMLIHEDMINNYSLKTTDDTTSFVEESIFQLPGKSNFAFDIHDGTLYFTVNDQEIHHYDPEKNTARVCFTQAEKSIDKNIEGLCVSPCQRTLYFSLHRKRNRKFKATNQLCFYNLNEKKIYKRIPLNSPVEKISISPDETLLAVESTRHNKIQLLDTQFGRNLKVLNKCHFPVAFSQDGKTLAARHAQGYIEHNFIDENIEKNLRNYPALHIALLDSCATILDSNKNINLSQETIELFEQLPKKIQSYLNRRARAEFE